MVVCSSCGQENPGDARFCLACAAPLAAQAPSARDVRKTITVVFSDVAGSTSLGERLDPEAVRAVMGRYFEEMRAVVEHHGGTVEKFIGDAVMAVFGIPVLHEDDALRAVRAAAEMREALGSLNDELERERGVRIQVRVGVNTGEVVAGDGSGGQRFATGDAVNVASRLQHAARPGEILIGESTHRLVRDAVTVESIRPLSLKGKRQAVAAVRLLDVRDFTGRRLAAPIVGRERELEFLEQAFDGVVRDRACRLVTVLGSPGVGKSRLVEEFLSDRAGAATVLRGRCLPYGQGITYWPIKNVISQAAGLSGEESPEAAREKIRSLVATAPDADLIVERVAEAIGLAKSTGQRGTLWALGRLLEELSKRQPLIVVFDDIQWGEPTFLDLVETVAGKLREAPLLLLCLARHELFELRPAWGGTDPDATRLLLGALSDAESERLIANLLGAPEHADAVRARIVERAGGNPLFVEELVSMLMDEGLGRNGSPAAARDWSRVVLPPTIRALLAARLDRLGRDERAVLERGSVEGKVFHRGAVLALSPETDHARLDGRLRMLAQQELIRRGPAGFADEQAYHFHHQLLRDVAYESLAKAGRAELHERFADWLEAKTAQRAEEFEEILGHHLQQAYGYKAALGPVDDQGRELAVRAANHLGSAGSRAHARGDMWAARKLLASAVALLPGEAAARLRPKLDEALFETGASRRWISRASVRCFWRRPLGHRWEIKESAGMPMLRCADCGRAKGGPRGLKYLIDKPAASGRGGAAWSHASSGGAGGDADGGAGV